MADKTVHSATVVRSGETSDRVAIDILGDRCVCTLEGAPIITASDGG